MSPTAGRNDKTRAMPDTAVAQAKQAMRNVEGALVSVGASLDDVVRRRIFIPRQEDVPAVMAYMGDTFRGIDPASCVSCGPWAAPNTCSRSRSRPGAVPRASVEMIEIAL